MGHKAVREASGTEKVLHVKWPLLGIFWPGFARGYPLQSLLGPPCLPTLDKPWILSHGHP